MSQSQRDQTPLPARIPQPLAPKLQQYLYLLAASAPGLVSGCYLSGSLALDAFDERCSDIDFVAFLSHPATASDIALLRGVHEQVERGQPRWKLEGSYLQWHDAGRLPPQVAPGPHCAGSVLHASGHHDLNLVTWWLVKQRGITLLGPEPQDLPFTIEWAEVTAYMRDNLHAYWRGFTRPSQRMAWLLTDWGVAWAVLGICRLWHAFEVQRITSKVAAGEAMLRQAAPRWRKLVAEGLALRRGEASCYRWRMQRAVEAAKFVDCVVNECGRRDA